MVKTVKCGKLDLTFNDETGELQDVVIHIGAPYGLLIAANAIDAAVLYYALRHAFEDGKPHTSSVELLRRARERGSSWSYLMPLVDRPELFWLCAGTISNYVPAEQMREVYSDFVRAQVFTLETEDLFSTLNKTQSLSCEPPSRNHLSGAR